MNIVIGHKKPDSDAVLSAIALSEIKKIENLNFKPKVASEITNETKYILQETGFKEPELQKSVSPIVRDNIDKEYPFAEKGTKLYEAIKLMKQNRISKIPILQKNKFIGILDYYKVADFVFDKMPKYDLSEHLVDEFIVEEKTINPNDYISNFREELTGNFVRFVVENNVYLGALTEKNVLKPKRYNVMLVDHNEFSQAVDGIEEAKIVAIYDHHKIALKTDEAIDIKVRPLGSTCSVLYEYVLEKNYKIDEKLKKLLLYGIIADTMGFRLVTTTDLDKQFVSDLSSELGLDWKEIDRNIIKAATNIEGIPLEKLIFNDYKEFFYGTVKVGVGVLTIAEFDQIKDKYNEIKNILQKTKEEQNYDFIGLMICEVIPNKTTFVGFGSKLDALADHFKKPLKDNAFEVEWILSRKKEIMPVLSKFFS